MIVVLRSNSRGEWEILMTHRSALSFSEGASFYNISRNIPNAASHTTLAFEDFH